MHSIFYLAIVGGPTVPGKGNRMPCSLGVQIIAPHLASTSGELMPIFVRGGKQQKLGIELRFDD